MAAKLTEVCPVDIFAVGDGGALAIVEANLDECVLCRLCIDAAPAGTVDGPQALRRRRHALRHWPPCGGSFSPSCSCSAWPRSPRRPPSGRLPVAGGRQVNPARRLPGCRLRARRADGGRVERGPALRQPDRAAACVPGLGLRLRSGRRRAAAGTRRRCLPARPRPRRAHDPAPLRDRAGQRHRVTPRHDGHDDLLERPGGGAGLRAPVALPGPGLQRRRLGLPSPC